MSKYSGERDNEEVVRHFTQNSFCILFIFVAN
jgi:hypothetical protein